MKIVAPPLVENVSRDMVGFDVISGIVRYNRWDRPMIRGAARIRAYGHHGERGNYSL